MELVRGHHSVGEANVHLQFTPKYRREVFRDRRVREVCEESFRETAGQLGVVMHALAFGLTMCMSLWVPAGTTAWWRW